MVIRTNELLGKKMNVEKFYYNPSVAYLQVAFTKYQIELKRIHYSDGDIKKVLNMMKNYIEDEMENLLLYRAVIDYKCYVDDQMIGRLSLFLDIKINALPDIFKGELFFDLFNRENGTLEVKFQSIYS